MSGFLDSQGWEREVEHLRCGSGRLLETRKEHSKCSLPGVLCPALRFTVQKNMDSLEQVQRWATEMVRGLERQADPVGIVQPEGEKASGPFYSSLPVDKERL